jgi:putative ABC transport system permease protein
VGIFAAVALALAVVGIYGVVAWNVTQRTREIGIHQALGANRADVLRLVVGQSMRVVGIGLVIGIALSLAVARLVSSEVFGISSFDPLTFAIVIALLAGSALVACLLPARRATKVDPLTALRAD